MQYHQESLKKKALHIVLPVILIANLLFSQVAINLFHNNHDSRKATVELKKGQTGIQKQVEHCKICALDILFNLFYNAPAQFDVQPVKDTLIVSLAVDVKTALVFFSQGRAPPVFI